MGRDGCRVRAWVSYSRRRPGALPLLEGAARSVTRIFVGAADIRWRRADVGVVGRDGCRVRTWVSYSRRRPGAFPTEGAGPSSYFKPVLGTRIFVGDAHIRWRRGYSLGTRGCGCRGSGWVSRTCLGDLFSTAARCLPLLEGAARVTRIFVGAADICWGRADVGVVGRDGCRVRAWVSYSRRRPGAFPTEGAGPSSYFEAFAVLHTSMFVSMSGQTTSGGLQCRLFVLM